jgi:hypothetical protein
VFRIEPHPKKPATFRVTRTTTGKPKTKTYGGHAAIVDGSDGRTYILQFAAGFDFIMVSRSDFKDARSPVWPRDGEYIALAELIQQANPELP